MVLIQIICVSFNWRALDSGRCTAMDVFRILISCSASCVSCCWQHCTVNWADVLGSQWQKTQCSVNLSQQLKMVAFMRVLNLEDLT